MFDSAVFQVIIALVFLLALFSVAVSTLTEATTRFMGLRGAQLLRGIKSLVDGNADDEQITTTYRLFGTVFLGTAGQAGRTRDSAAAGADTTSSVEQLAADQDAFRQLATDKGNWQRKRKLPSYIASRQFASAVLAEILPERVDGATPPPLPTIRTKITESLHDSPLRDALMGIVDEVGNDVDKIRTRIETLYDDHMDRVSGWYKRHARSVQIVFAAIVVVFFNFNLLRVGDFLWQSDGDRAAIVEVAGQFSCPTPEGDGQVSFDAAGCVEDARNAIAELGTQNLPLFWNSSASCENVENGAACFFHSRGIWVSGESGLRNLVFILVGYGAAIAGLVPGSRFWFDALSKLNSLRSTGAKPPPANATQ
jgi:hypothetical protein